MRLIKCIAVLVAGLSVGVSAQAQFALAGNTYYGCFQVTQSQFDVGVSAQPVEPTYCQNYCQSQGSRFVALLSSGCSCSKPGVDANNLIVNDPPGCQLIFVVILLFRAQYRYKQFSNVNPVILKYSIRQEPKHHQYNVVKHGDHLQVLGPLVAQPAPVQRPRAPLLFQQLNLPFQLFVSDELDFRLERGTIGDGINVFRADTDYFNHLISGINTQLNHILKLVGFLSDYNKHKYNNACSRSRKMPEELEVFAPISAMDRATRRPTLYDPVHETRAEEPRGSSEIHFTHDMQKLSSSSGEDSLISQDYRPNTSHHDRTPEILKNYDQTHCGEAFESLREDTSAVEYSFPLLLTTRNLRKLPIRSVQALVSEQCFVVPPRPLLDHFMVHYFLHVHPFLPMLDESAFWGGYFGVCSVEEMEFSLLLFQAMLFASCNFVSAEVIKALGFNSTTDAKTSFYKKAKTSPTDTVPKLTTGRSRSTIWLAVANQNAMSAATNLGDADKCTLNRLQWCCLIRDRLLALGENRQLLIAAEDFKFHQDVEHGVDALQEELKRSRVYALETRSRLADIIGDMLRLCVVMTDTLVLAFGTEATPRPPSTTSIKLGRFKARLSEWHSEVSDRQERDTRPDDEPAMFYTNVMMINYQ
ncbi:fungal specific transcription factor domain-containing protein [Colletotrichum plurivorum]|uniref:Fungal specific transcription factor domain-containing protein n=1 Tax=Colletotrichum plurivorum TaxID=2175906 RepID=A0A8H6K656_9PEZI|nr:fungal specific transcription factor domain-containing protein [Colletotrichum plurivorum]